MKNIKILLLAAVGLLFAAAEVKAQGTAAQNDSTVTAIKIKNLNKRKAQLQKQIAAEDKKRNNVTEGATPETQERRRDRQDSICLQLRSDLVEVELELKEMGANRKQKIIKE